MVDSFDIYRCECGTSLEPHHNPVTKRNYWKCPKCGALYEIEEFRRYKLTKYGNKPCES